MNAISLPMNDLSDLASNANHEPPLAVRALTWKNNHWMLAVLTPAATLLVLSTLGLGYLQVEGVLLQCLFVFGLLPFSFGLPALFWGQVAAKAAVWYAKRKEGQDATLAREAKLESERRAVLLQRFQRLGMHRLTLAGAPFSAAGQVLDLTALAAFIVTQDLLSRFRQMMEAAKQLSGSAHPGVTLLSVAFPQPLLWRHSLDEKSFCLEMAEKLRTQALQQLSPTESLGIDAQIQEHFNALFRLEVWVLKDADLLEKDADLGFLAVKPLMAHDALVHYVVQSRAAVNAGVFQAWQFPLKRGRGPVRESRTALLLPESASITALTGQRSTGLRDVTLEERAQETHVGIDELHQNKSLQTKLGLRVIHQATPFPLLDSYTSTFKGTIRCVGWWDEDGWHSMADIVRSRLSASAPNWLKKGVQSLIPTEDSTDSENLVLRELLSMTQQDFGRAVSSVGNFEIRRGPKQKDSPVFKYFIRLNQDSDTITRIHRSSGKESITAHRDRNSYEEIGSSVALMQPSPLEQQGYQRLPFSEGYLLTGDSSLQLCLHLDLGSPSLGEGMADQAPLQFDEDTLPAALAAFAEKAGATDYHQMENGTAQGLTATAKLPGMGSCYLKLVEAVHTRRYRTVTMLDRLMEAQILPHTIRHQRITSRGQASENGELHVFVTPAYRSVAIALREETLDDQQRLACWAELNRFCLRLRNLGIFCTDLTLADLMFDAPSLAEALKLAAETPGAPAFFVVDYGSYVQQRDFSREAVIVKDEMTAPEDWDLGLPYEPEAYQVYLQGLLALQILCADPGHVPESVLRQRDIQRHSVIEKRLWEEMLPRLKPLLEQLPDEKEVLTMLRRMLSCQPTQRPSLQEIAE
jgi:hypothetical protein